MDQKRIEFLADQLDREFLDFVLRPGRYIGGEVNQLRKDLAHCDVKVALCFPDVYEVAMSHTGMAVLYEVFNRLEGVAAERVFSPWIDAEQVLRAKAIPLFSLESKASLRSFDVVGFSLTNELCYTNVLTMLDLAGLPIRSRDRGPDDPVVIAGGGMAHCAEPMAEFIDAFVLGDGEEAAVELVQLFRECRTAGLDKAGFLLAAARRFDWVYVPGLYQVDYDGDRIKAITPKVSGLAIRRNSAVVEDLENAPVPTRPIVPFVQAVHERVSLEIMRGCPGRCRFCQVSFCKRPIRFRSVDRLVDLAKACCESTGFDTISLLSLSSAEYPHLEELLRRLRPYCEPRHVGISVPSLRVDRQLRLLPELLTSVRKSGLTLAVEAASERLRAILNKPLSDEDLLATAEAAYQAGWQRIKLYFMVGLPSETEADVRHIVDLAYEMARRRVATHGRKAEIAVTVSWLVPKPHTPFGWLAQRPRSYFEQARHWILEEKQRLQARCLIFKFHPMDQSLLESAIGRGDRRLADVIESAWRAGARFDLWDECFDYLRWKEAFIHHGLDVEALASRSFDADEILPWEHLGGPENSYLLDHLNKAMDSIEDAQQSPMQ
jgi:radical SAM family uncharacterized protein